MKSVNPYLNFNGNTEEAFKFYKSIFGGEFVILQRFKDMPGAEKMTPPNEMNRIMHVSLPLGKVGMLMGSDAPESRGMKVAFGNSVNISIEAESEEEAMRLFKGLSDKGKVAMPIGKQFWGAMYGMCTDKFGINWMINYTYPQAMG